MKFYFLILILFAVNISHIYSQDENWSIIDSNAHYFIYAVDTYDSNNIAYIASNNVPLPDLYLSYLCRLSTDGGNSWETIFMDDLNDGDSVGMFEARSIIYHRKKTIYLVDLYGNTFKTTDLGKNWNFINFQEKSRLILLKMLKNNKALIKFESNEFLYFSYDGGDSWERKPVNLDFITNRDFKIKDLVWLKDEILLVAGLKNNNESVIFRSEDLGKNWEKSYIVNQGKLDNLYFLNEDNIWSFGSYIATSGLVKQLIYKTTNAGESWIKQMQDDNRYTLYDMDFLNKKHGIITTSQPFYFRTSNSGKQWEKVFFMSDDMKNYDPTQFICQDVEIPSGNYQYMKALPNVLFKYDPETSVIADLKLTENEILIYPNPIKKSGIVHVKFNLKKPGPITMNLYNNMGFLVDSKTNRYANSGHHISKLKAKEILSSGVYWLKIFSNGILLFNSKIIIY